MNMFELGQRARTASRRLAQATTEQKNAALLALAERLAQEQAAVLAENALDVEAAKAAGLAASLVDRLLLTPARLAGMAADLRKVAELPDPVGETFDETVLPNGLKLCKRRVPLGVLGVIYESRPNVTIDIAGLALKTGNAVILRGGKETLRSNLALLEVIHGALAEAGLPADAVAYIDDIDRARITELLTMDSFVDLIIPRGGAGLHQFCRENSRIPVITGGIGICHIFVDETADLEAALPVIHNAKTQRPSVCNALDTVLVHRTLAAQFLPRLLAHLEPAGVSFRAHESAVPFLGQGGVLPASVQPADAQDFDTEWMALILGLKVVASLDEAIAHINTHSQGHSDSILTADRSHAERFVAEVDSAAVYVNASTRFTDGGQFGLGAEVAISTQRLHARGPMGLRELTTYKWVGIGDYHVRR
ncbi:MAG: glutamate-5-semialdehyde dehydrogenase [Chloroflexota bacterium]